MLGRVPLRSSMREEIEKTGSSPRFVRTAGTRQAPGGAALGVRAEKVCSGRVSTTLSSISKRYKCGCGPQMRTAIAGLRTQTEHAMAAGAFGRTQAT